MAEALSYDDIILNQRKEKKDLTALTQKMKHSVSKGDKKKKKEMNAEIAEMIAKLDLKHEEELKNFHDKQSCVVKMTSLEASTQSSVEQDCANELNLNQVTTAENIESTLEQKTQSHVLPNLTKAQKRRDKPSCNVQITSPEASTQLSIEQDCANELNDQVTTAENIESTLEQETQPHVLPKLSKAQKRRNRKAESAKDRQRAIQEQEILNLSGSRHLEMAEISKKLAERGLVVYEVPSDGNCLYNAIEHQLLTHKLEGFSMKSLRKLTSEYLLSHKDEYIPFLTNLDTGDIFSDEQFVKYCNDVKNTAAWGGHVEIQVLSHVCGKPIEVIQAGGPSIIAGNETDTPKLLIS